MRPRNEFKVMKRHYNQQNKTNNPHSNLAWGQALAALSRRPLSWLLSLETEVHLVQLEIPLSWDRTDLKDLQVSSDATPMPGHALDISSTRLTRAMLSSYPTLQWLSGDSFCFSTVSTVGGWAAVGWTWKWWGDSWVSHWCEVLCITDGAHRMVKNFSFCSKSWMSGTMFSHCVMFKDQQHEHGHWFKLWDLRTMDRFTEGDNTLSAVCFQPSLRGVSKVVLEVLPCYCVTVAVLKP